MINKKNKIFSFLDDYLEIFGFFLFLIISTIILYNRHFYDDEIFNIYFIKKYDFFSLFALFNSFDVHPPLSYMINSFFYLIFKDFKMAIFPILLLNSYALYFFFKNYRRKITDPYELILVYLFTFLNPQILMWTNSLRWYAVWTPLFIIVYTLILICQKNKYTYLKSIMLFTIMLYLNYIMVFSVMIM